MRLKIFVMTALCLLSFSLLKAQTISQWRGLDRSGYFPANNLYEKWPGDGPVLELHVDNLPGTYSSVVVKDEVIYTTGVVEEDEFLTALKADGTILWTTRYGDAWGKSYREGRCTPTIEDGFAYLISGAGDLGCVDLMDGSLTWSVDGYTTFGAAYGTWGTAESPLIVGDKLIYTPCGDQTTMVAVDKHSGSTMWTSESINDQSGYVSPILIERGGKQLIITVTGNHVICVNAADGAIFWKLRYTDYEKPMMGVDINPVTPLVKGNEIFVTSGYNHVGLMLEMAADYKSVSVKWISEDLDVHHGGVVQLDGFIYGSNYTSIKKGNWVCLDWESGEVMYEQEWNTKGQIIASQGMLICYEERRGNLALVEARPDKFAIRSEFRIEHGSGPHWCHPSIYGNKLYLRHGKSLLGYRIGE